MQSLIHTGEIFCCKYTDKPYLAHNANLYEEFEHNEHCKAQDESLSKVF